MKNLLFILTLFTGLTVKAQVSNNEIIKVSNKRALAELEVVVSPNPSRGSIHVNAPFGAVCKVVSSKGTYIGTWDVGENGFSLDELSVGIYVVVISYEGQAVTRRFLVI